MEKTPVRLERLKYLTRAICVTSLFLVTGISLHAQGRGPVPQTPKAAAPIDITGYWLSVVTEDWRFRMVTPPKGDYLGVPLNPAGRKIADAWDPAKDEAAGEQCRAYGAPNIMRQPGRIHITWQGEETLKVETDAGTQTRLLAFGAPQGRGGDWQGVSNASWEFLTYGGLGFGPPQLAPGGSLKVVTTKFKPGYVRKNGVPYSANAVLTEYYDRVDEPTGESYLLITMIVDDPAYLFQPMYGSTHFRKQPNASGSNPTPCSAR
jgi:hypothetical protein